jgi:hypothetical protein
MSDELPGGYISLENEDGSAVAREPEPEPAAEPAAEPEAAVEPATEPEAPTEEDDDAEPADMLTDGTGRRYVPVSALQREREARKELKRQLAQPRGLSAEEQKQLDSARYIAQQLKGRPDIIEALQSGQRLTREQQRTVERVEEKAGAPIAQPVAQFDDAELREVAELQGYYDASGAPDLKAAERYLGILDRRAAKLADARVAPLLQRDTHNASERQIERIAEMAAEMGVSPDEARPVLRELAKANPQMMAESTEYGLAGVIFAAGMKALQRQKAQPEPTPEPKPAAAPKPEPLMVERSIGPAKTPSLSTGDRARMKQYGVDPKALEHANDLLKKADGGTIVFERD